MTARRSSLSNPFFEHPICLLLLLGAAACSGSDGGGSTIAAGGASNGGGSATGGAPSMAGSSSAAGANATGGAIGIGGRNATGGVANVDVTGGGKATGGLPATGGTAAIGGALSTGGTKSSAGASSVGGAQSTGGNSSAAGGKSGGGTANTGATNSTGGSVTTGGALSTGGAKSTGGVTATGGAKATGGNPATGGSSAAGGTGTCGAIVPFDAAALAKCTGTNPIECHFGGATGNYEVSVQLGGASVAGNTYIEAETSRRMLATTSTAAGQTQCFNFVVNVRQPEGQPIQAVAAGTPGLDLYFKGNAPQLKAIGYRVMSAPIVVYLAGDSTVCDQTDTNYAGWGQFLPQKFNHPISIANYADSGESSGSFLGSGSLWGAIKSRMKANDWVFIQFGHNDKTTDEATFRSNMTTMVNNAKAAGVKPILVTPPARIGYTLAEELVNDLGVDVPQVIRDLGASLGVPVIDLTVTVWNWQQTLGNGWTNYYALGTDHTHTNANGADVISGFVADAIRNQGIGLLTYLR